MNLVCIKNSIGRCIAHCFLQRLAAHGCTHTQDLWLCSRAPLERLEATTPPSLSACTRRQNRPSALKGPSPRSLWRCVYSNKSCSASDSKNSHSHLLSVRAPVGLSGEAALPQWYTPLQIAMACQPQQLLLQRAFADVELLFVCTQVKTIAGSAPSYFRFGAASYPGYAAPVPAVVTAAPTTAPTPPLVVLPVGGLPTSVQRSCFHRLCRWHAANACAKPCRR
jgi:hypothetical protein